MSDLVRLVNDEYFSTSLIVSKKFNKVHSKVVRSIEKVLENEAKNKGAKNGMLKFTEIEEEYRGQKFKTYLMDKKAFIMLAMGFTGQKAFKWKLKFIDAFCDMEKAHLQMKMNEKNLEWKQVREQGKLARREETDVIKQFVEYATTQGSKNAKFYYKHLTNAVYKCLNLIQYKKPKLRETLDFMELSQLIVAENIAKNSMTKYMSEGEHYKVIFELVKQDLLKYADVVLIKKIT